MKSNTFLLASFISLSIATATQKHPKCKQIFAMELPNLLISITLQLWSILGLWQLITLIVHSHIFPFHMVVGVAFLSHFLLHMTQLITLMLNAKFTIIATKNRTRKAVTFGTLMFGTMTGK